MDIEKKREKEKQTVSRMIEIYCHGKHKTDHGMLCKECRELQEYALARIAHCPHMSTKTFCSKCTTKCYVPLMKERIREVMRYAGPRMLLYSPLMVIRHVLEDLK